VVVNTPMSSFCRANVTAAILLGLLSSHALPRTNPSNRLPPTGQPPAQATGQSPAQADAGATIDYVPPDRGAPEARVSGGTRGPSAAALRVDVLTPRQIGLTLRDQPVLYWYSSWPIATAVQITVVEDETDKTVLKTYLPGPVPAGIHAFPLAATRLRLALNVDYQWSVTVELSPRERSRNVVASGMIRRVSVVGPPVSSPGSPYAAAAYARAGLWYDALDAISQAILEAPRSGALRLRRSRLLEQVGLSEAAEFDRATAAR